MPNRSIDVGVVEPGQREGQGLAGELLRQGGDEVLHRADDVLVLDERHLDVELGELGLAVGPEVLVAEASGDLEVAVEPGDHQDLLVELRRLRERVEVGRVDAAGDEEVAGAFGRAPAQDRRLDLEEAEARHRVAHQLRHLVAEDEDLLHRRPTEVEVAILEPEFLVGLAAAVDLEGRGGRGVEDLELGGPDLDGAGLELGVLLAREPGGDDPPDADDVLVAEFLGLLERRRSPSEPGSKTTWVRP